jgi:hypothetical protein
MVIVVEMAVTAFLHLLMVLQQLELVAVLEVLELT